MMQLSIVIPCYNESGNLSALIGRCESLVTDHPDVEVILVNNGSTDNSADLMAELIAKTGKANIRSHHVAVNKGYGHGILAGLQQATADVICWTHADMQTDIFDCVKALGIYQKSADPYTVVKGRRKGRPVFDKLFTSLMSFYVLFKLGKYTPDVNAQPKLFSRQFYSEIAGNAPGDFSLDLYFLVNAKSKGRIIEFPVDFAVRTAGEAKGGSGDLKLKIKLTKRTLAFINKFKIDQ
ncbi:glycosyltransferase family 2 protein [Mucilaginibacter myungsuensis]|uniref:Glycosyltransferase family 2 protein n=1 Tax=Mucilaginibacter myungsuensis TaxID=649104 RepID=A0A929KVI5_9SPHI|nr:glycosyltransferase family 2 protein [Mucilaginibacter myungsuensis]MBE9662379.1 glycosyltransferase family 2 protein [Mucilaginibacter myungsuensis]MDN3599184.1 glycosyltransferase family 2 protein [Mucilaginibacter myungsuensis]